MWYCSSCGFENEDRARFCVECGTKRPAEAEPARETLPPEEDARYARPGNRNTTAPRSAGKKSRRWLWLLLALALLAAAAVACYFAVHLWTPATCTEPETCRICGKTQGFPLGHSATPATCTEPETCKRCGAILSPALGHEALPADCEDASVCARCGETLSPALGHDWLPATYAEPETCSRCGETRGEVKGYLGDLDGHVDSEDLYLYSNNQSHAYVLDRPVNNCLHLTLGLKLTAVSGSPYGDWGLFARDLQGNWKRLDTFFVAATAYNNYVTFDFDLDGSASFDALSILPVVDSDYTISYSFYYEDVQEYVG